MEIFLLIVAVLVALVIIGKLKGDPDIEKLDVAGLKREIWVTQNWINNYCSGGCPPKYLEKFQYKQSRLEQANAQLDKLTSHQTTNGGGIASNKTKETELIASNKMDDSEESKSFLIVHSIRQLTDLALSQGLIESQEKARKYWESFKTRILFFHFKRKEMLNKVGSEIESASLDEVRSAIEKELEPVFKRATLFINEGMSEELALAKSIVEWYKYNNSLVQSIQSTNSKRGNKLAEEEIDALISNSARALDFDMGWLANDIALQAEQGNANSRCQLAAMYCNGQHGVPLDYTEAAKWYKLAAEQGDANAKFRVELILGGMYDEGRGVPQNYTEAAKWYKLAAELGDADAQFKLGEMYDEGRGVPQDGIVAQMWFEKSQE